MNRGIGIKLFTLSCCAFAIIASQLGCEPSADSSGKSYPSNNEFAQQTSRQTSAYNGAQRSTNKGQLVSTKTPGSHDSFSTGIPQRSQQSILIASFNIQTFGVKKVSNPKLANRLAQLIRCFDVVAVQEIRAKDQTVIPQLLAYVNANGARYDYVIGPHLGRTVSVEQYAFIYDSDRVITKPEATYTIEDQADLLHREPLVSRFVTRVPNGFVPFSFALMDIHTDPDEVKQELPVMHTVFKSVREYEWATVREDDVILLGDLNAGPSMFGQLATMPGIHWAIHNQPTNTRRTELYDNIIFDRELTNEFTGRSGVLDLREAFNINESEALEISDHCPIWAEFSIVEQPSSGNYSMAGENSPPQRR